MQHGQLVAQDGQFDILRVPRRTEPDHRHEAPKDHHRDRLNATTVIMPGGIVAVQRPNPEVAPFGLGSAHGVMAAKVSATQSAT